MKYMYRAAKVYFLSSFYITYYTIVLKRLAYLPRHLSIKILTLHTYTTAACDFEYYFLIVNFSKQLQYNIYTPENYNYSTTSTFSK